MSFPSQLTRRKVWDVRTGELLNTLEGHTGSVFSLAIIRPATSSSSSSTPSALIASASFDHTIKLWNLYTGECVGTLEGHTDFVTCVRAVGDRTLVSSSNDKTVKARITTHLPGFRLSDKLTVRS